MCTVTLIQKSNNEFILTSNRDESPKRLPFQPKEYEFNGVKMMFPKDKIAGGTWIGVSEHNRLICLLNGGFKNHKHNPPYRKSRGLVVKELLSASDIISEIETYNFDNIEPFTIVLVDFETKILSYELVWTGENISFKKLSKQPHIWSSSTLYKSEMKEQRQQWFNDFILDNKLTSETIMKFHNSKSKNKDFGFIMNRDIVKTTSITQIEKVGDAIHFNYKSLAQNTVTNLTIKTKQSIHG